MNVASLSLCKELFLLSSWEIPGDDAPQYCKLPTGKNIIRRKDSAAAHGSLATITCPAYDLGFLLEKLPLEHTYRKYTGKLRLVWVDLDEKLWEASYNTDDIEGYDTIPVNAVCKLCCELIRQGIIKP